MQISPTAPAITDFHSLVTLTQVGAPVAPVIATLDHAVQSLKAARPVLEQAHAAASTLDAVDRAQGGAATLRNALAELQANEGMTTFDTAFAADDPSWDATFTGWADALADDRTAVWHWSPTLRGYTAAGTNDFSRTPPEYRSYAAFWASVAAARDVLDAGAARRAAAAAPRQAAPIVSMRSV